MMIRQCDLSLYPLAARCHLDSCRRMHARHVAPRSDRLWLLQRSTRPSVHLSEAIAGKRPVICAAAGQGQTSLQLATAKLPTGTNPDAFIKALYDWASSMTSSGRNLPFSLPVRTRQKDGGFEISLLRVDDNKKLVSVGDIVAKVEDEQQAGNVLIVRFFEGEGAQSLRRTPLPEHAQERLRTIVDGLVDVPLIMGSMKNAIRQAVTLAK